MYINILHIDPYMQKQLNGFNGTVLFICIQNQIATKSKLYYKSKAKKYG